jgi:L-asparaginase
MTPPRMLELSRRIEEELRDPIVTGVVVTHGTDTLEETAFLVDLVSSSAKPVVFVGAMRNSSELGWDGPANLRSAVRVAAHPDVRDLGALVVLNDRVLSAADAAKTNTEALDTFQARDFGALGLVDRDRVLILGRRPQREHISTARIEEHVEIVKLSAGSDGRFIRFAVETGVRGLVLEGLGRGNVPVTALDDVESALRAGLPVVLTSRCPSGRILDTYAYPGAGRPLRRQGAILGGFLPSHKARIKLMLLLGANASPERIRASFEGFGPDA